MASTGAGRRGGANPRAGQGRGRVLESQGGGWAVKRCRGVVLCNGRCNGRRRGVRGGAVTASAARNPTRLCSVVGCWNRKGGGLFGFFGWFVFSALAIASHGNSYCVAIWITVSFLATNLGLV